MSEELIVKETLKIIGEICENHPYCNGCPFQKFREQLANCHQSLAKHADEVAEICKQWKLDHAPVEVEWAYICRIIQDENGVKKCVYEEDITRYEYEFPFEWKESATESVLKKYCKNHKRKFFATVEHICRVKGK